MDIKIQNGDFLLDSCGKPQSISDRDELMQSIRIICSIPKESWFADSSFGAEHSSFLNNEGSIEEEKKYFESALNRALTVMKNVKIKVNSLAQEDGKTVAEAEFFIDGEYWQNEKLVFTGG